VKVTQYRIVGRLFSGRDLASKRSTLGSLSSWFSVVRRLRQVSRAIARRQDATDSAWSARIAKDHARAERRTVDPGKHIRPARPVGDATSVLIEGEQSCGRADAQPGAGGAGRIARTAAS
jgi:hypothetical protein